jgi:hypothetical protein
MTRTRTRKMDPMELENEDEFDMENAEDEEDDCRYLLPIFGLLLTLNVTWMTIINELLP